MVTRVAVSGRKVPVIIVQNVLKEFPMRVKQLRLVTNVIYLPYMQSVLYHEFSVLFTLFIFNGFHIVHILHSLFLMAHLFFSIYFPRGH